MKTVIEFPDKDVIQEEAAEWLVRLDGDNPLSQDDRGRLKDWLSRSPAHRAELRELARLWGNLNVLTELAVPLSQPKRRDWSLGRAWQHRPQLVALAATLIVGIG